MSFQQCANSCKNFRYFGRQFKSQCRCGNEGYDKHGLSNRCRCSSTFNIGRRVNCVYEYINYKPTSAPMQNPTKAPKGEDFIGCFSDKQLDRALPYMRGKKMSFQQCANACENFKYFGRQFTLECWCGDEDYDKHGKSNGCNCSSSTNVGGGVNCVYANLDAPISSPTKSPTNYDNVQVIKLPPGDKVKCDYGFGIEKSSCKDAGMKVGGKLTNGGVVGIENMDWGNNWRLVPPGCSIQNGSNHIHWNENPDGNGGSAYSPVCFLERKLRRIWDNCPPMSLFCSGARFLSPGKLSVFGLTWLGKNGNQNGFVSLPVSALIPVSALNSGKDIEFHEYSSFELSVDIYFNRRCVACDQSVSSDLTKFQREAANIAAPHSFKVSIDNSDHNYSLDIHIENLHYEVMYLGKVKASGTISNEIYGVKPSTVSLSISELKKEGNKRDFKLSLTTDGVQRSLSEGAIDNFFLEPYDVFSMASSADEDSENTDFFTEIGYQQATILIKDKEMPEIIGQIGEKIRQKLEDEREVETTIFANGPNVKRHVGILGGSCAEVVKCENFKITVQAKSSCPEIASFKNTGSETFFVTPEECEIKNIARATKFILKEEDKEIYIGDTSYSGYVKIINEYEISYDLDLSGSSGTACTARSAQLSNGKYEGCPEISIQTKYTNVKSFFDMEMSEESEDSKDKLRKWKNIKFSDEGKTTKSFTHDIGFVNLEGQCQDPESGFYFESQASMCLKTNTSVTLSYGIYVQTSIGFDGISIPKSYVFGAMSGSIDLSLEMMAHAKFSKKESKVFKQLISPYTISGVATIGPVLEFEIGFEADVQMRLEYKHSYRYDTSTYFLGWEKTPDGKKKLIEGSLVESNAEQDIDHGDPSNKFSLKLGGSLEVWAKPSIDMGISFFKQNVASLGLYTKASLIIASKGRINEVVKCLNGEINFSAGLFYDIIGVGSGDFSFITQTLWESKTIGKCDNSDSEPLEGSLMCSGIDKYIIDEKIKFCPTVSIPCDCECDDNDDRKFRKGSRNNQVQSQNYFNPLSAGTRLLQGRHNCQRTWNLTQPTYHNFPAGGPCECDRNTDGYLYIWTDFRFQDDIVKIGCNKQYEPKETDKWNCLNRIRDELQLTSTVELVVYCAKIDKDLRFQHLLESCPINLRHTYSCNAAEIQLQSKLYCQGKWNDRSRNLPQVANYDGYTEWFNVEFDDAINMAKDLFQQYITADYKVIVEADPSKHFSKWNNTTLWSILS